MIYDFNIFDKARALYSVPPLHFLDSMRTHVAKEKPYQGLKILHNTPLTLITAFKIEALALGGAEVTVTCIKALAPEQRAVELLKAANFNVQIEQRFDEAFDFHLDCCAELITLPPPQIGCIELTQTGSNRYKDAGIHYPMLSVDDSKLKMLETFLGTGDGFFRALYEQVNNELYNKPFVIFGCGKVGQGIIHALKNHTDDITVIDPHITVQIPNIKYVNPENKAQVKDAIKNAYCAVTATGINGLITDYYGLSKADFGACLLTNMGVDDEYGSNFDLKDVMFDKKPLNFSLQEPTAFHYLDPIMYAHNLGIDLILSNKIKNGYNAFPPTTANKIIEQWQAVYNEYLNFH